VAQSAAGGRPSAELRAAMAAARGTGAVRAGTAHLRVKPKRALGSLSGACQPVHVLDARVAGRAGASPCAVPDPARPATLQTTCSPSCSVARC